MKLDGLYKAMIENYPEPMMLVEVQTSTIIGVNQAAVNFYGYSEDEMVGMNMSYINTYSTDEIMQEINGASACVKNSTQLNHQLKDGSIKAVNVMSYPIVEGDVTYLFSVISENVTNKISGEIDILSGFYKSDDAMCIIDSNNIYTSNIIIANDAFNNLVEIEKKNLDKLSIGMFLTSDQVNKDGQITQKEFTGKLRTLNQQSEIQITISIMIFRYSGNEFYMLSIQPLNYFNLMSDLDLKKFNQGLMNTGLKLDGHLVKVSLFMNTNNLSVFELLAQKCEQKLKKLFSERQLTYYVENDSKNIYVYSTAELVELNNIMEILIDNFEHSFGECYEKYHFRSRIGISSYGPFSAQKIHDLEEVMCSFDLHEYNSIHTFSLKSSYYKKQNLKNGIRDAIETDQFVLYAQAIVDIDENCVEGYEVLIRWEHPEYDLISPNDFLPYAEFSGEIYDIDLWVLKNTFEFLREHPEEVKDFVFHVNLSTKTLSKKDFLNKILHLSTGINISNVVLEITEDPSTKSMDDIIDELRTRGFQFAIDDFGKGYSSFERIRNIGIEYVKIDKTFIEGLTENVDDVLILKAIIGMCSNLNIKVIAEGIEHIEQLEFLYSRKCKLIQGFIFSKPEPLKSVHTSYDALKISTHDIICELTSDIVLSKKFYSNGRIIQQDMDPYFNMVTPNVALAEALGYEFEEFIDMKILDLLPSQYKKTFMRFVNGYTSEVGFKTMMIKLLTRTMSECKVICVVQKKADESNYRLYIEFLDNLEENEIELLGLSHSYLQSFDEAPSGMMILSDAFMVKKWNVSCEKIFGYDQKSIIGQNVIKKITSNDQVKMMNILLHKALKEGLIEMVIKNVNSSNDVMTTRWHVNIVFDELEQSHQYICIVNDITESIQKSHKLMKINKALDQSQSIIIISDSEGKIEYVNQKFYDVTGYTHDDIMGVNMRIISSNDKSTSYYEKIGQEIKAGQVWNGEVHNKKKDGNLYWSKTTIYPIKDDDEITGYVCIQTDTTAEKELQNVNINLKNKLFEQDKIASVGLLSSGIMHEINNPLSFVQGNVEYLMEEFDNYSNLDQEELNDLKDALSDINTGVTQIKKIAEGLKKYIFQGDVDEKVTVDLVEEINTVLVISKNEYKYYANVEVEFDKTLTYTVVGYASKLKQVLMNLVINASHAISSMKKEKLGKISIQLKSTSDQIWLIVKDDGCGMAPETISRIFEPFFTTKSVGVGSGLGLSVTRQIIEDDHNGVIICESEINQGTTFIIKLFKSL